MINKPVYEIKRVENFIKKITWHIQTTTMNSIRAGVKCGLTTFCPAAMPMVIYIPPMFSFNYTSLISLPSQWTLASNYSDQGWESLKLRLLISPYGKFSIWQKYLLKSLNHIHSWQMSLQLSCRDTCQLWRWYLIGSQYLDDTEMGKITERRNWA